ncbi:Uncharacterised protein [Mycobacteroides abscessus subsp. abscessus]|nr:Uncharacterised protein [Mycobacteroides abscessus subsp. abscessus]
MDLLATLMGSPDAASTSVAALLRAASMSTAASGVGAPRSASASRCTDIRQEPRQRRHGRHSRSRPA